MLSCCLALFFVIISNVTAEFCENGAEIIARGISQQGRIDVVDEHNRLRLLIAQGQVPGQPRGVDLKRMSYDDKLEVGARRVSDTCTLKTVLMRDERWYTVGQNMVQYQGAGNYSQNWKMAINFWFDQNKQYNYYGGLTFASQGYTQVVWAKSNLVGCDFIQFYNASNTAMPFIQIYTCNYGPPGNDNDYPYKHGTSGCENLC